MAGTAVRGLVAWSLARLAVEAGLVPPALRAGPGQPPSWQPRPLMGPGCSAVAVQAASGAAGPLGVMEAPYCSGLPVVAAGPSVVAPLPH